MYVQRASPDFSAADAMRGITSANKERSIGPEWDGGVALKEEAEEEEKDTAEGMEGVDSIDAFLEVEEEEVEEEEVEVEALCVGE
jgi:hypothetical protein